jgi:hypothetical protein
MKKQPMKKIIIFLLTISTCSLHAQETAKVEIPETYELSNIILALTNYGLSDEFEVLKGTAYYNEVMRYFEPVKKHPLLDSVNYSRARWEDYLSFRTDAVAFSFDQQGNLTRDFPFYANQGHHPFDKNVALIEDFVAQSGFRKFFADHAGFYDRIIKNYQDYNYVTETIRFLDSLFERKKADAPQSIYKIILSPLVNRMNCHRQLRENVVADFPSATGAFINGAGAGDNVIDRLNSNHMIFTEKDHEYVNPVTEKYFDLVTSHFNTGVWDNGSGYEGVHSFNEYMTWAVYDLFLEAYFPEYASSLSRQWQYQNATRGFFAQPLFSEKMKELSRENTGKKWEAIYEPLLKWTKEIENSVTLPTLVGADREHFVKMAADTVTIHFSEPMNTALPFGAITMEVQEDEQTDNNEFVEITDAHWTNDGKTVQFKINTKFEKFALLLSWWGIEKPLVSENGIFLEAGSYILIEK